MFPEPFILPSFMFFFGLRLGRALARKGVNANDIFQGKNYLAIVFLILYIGLLLLARFVPEMSALPFEWRVYSLKITWTILRLLLVFICGIGFAISWYTARVQVVAVVLIGLLGLGGFNAAESYFLAPIHATLEDNLQHGVFKQTSNSSCGPSALATVLRLWGIEATESSVAKLAGTTRLGTSMPQLLVATRAMGMDRIELDANWEQMQRINRPGVLGYWSGSGLFRLPHAVALLGLNDNFAIVGDPSWGRIYRIRRARFEQFGGGQYLPILRPQDISIPREIALVYLQQIGEKVNTKSEVASAIRRLQKSVGVKVTGELDTQTVLLLSGSFLKGVPMLKSRDSLNSLNLDLAPVNLTRQGINSKGF
ncbi:cyclic nucleotide-regulated ABC bacteriocin/lantibiotic exporter [Microseira wollei NIES-4236]|uniref:Cyclic nucleotide-regulated ABC bacteriocin/lantibiotic exporter n=2 Tax=Microseira wollei TaxID=467598 RepID=A0AAV3XKT8_9CYAN|nr:cyclic nucleotide-regulated ABC bacteriocin/lantibiotic exporter [Microseira wollei NIES-4236]